jgi:hypothetical protein
LGERLTHGRERESFGFLLPFSLLDRLERDERELNFEKEIRREFERVLGEN